MATTAAKRKTTGFEIAAWIFMGLALLLALKLHLLPALLAGLFVCELVRVLAPKLRFTSLKAYHARLAVGAALSITIVILLTLLVWAIISVLRHEPGNVPLLMIKMAEIISGYKADLPAWIADYIPADAEDIRHWIAGWLRGHAGELQLAGREAGRAVVHIIFGMVLGILISLRIVAADHEYRPLARAIVERIGLFGDAFRAVIFAQVRIAAVNTILTALYLGVILPMFGIHLPLVKTMIAVTFLVGLIPVAGNVISNTIIVVVSLNTSFQVAVSSLVFLLLIHKLEYFLNARIIGGVIHARAWELLLAILVMEAAFGLEGVIAAPVYYAYIKSELVREELV
jgi:predicted PurR-regulated permease PerM